MEGTERRDVHANGEEETGVEHPTEELVVELEMHEVTHDDDELDRHHDQQRRQEQRTEFDVVRRHFESGDCGKNQRNVDIAACRHAVLGMFGFAVARRCVFSMVGGVGRHDQTGIR